MEVTRCRIETGTCWPIALALQTMTGSALGLVKFRREREVGKPLRRNLNIVGVDNIPAELMGQCGYLRAWPPVLDEPDEVLGLAAQARLG